MPRNKSEPSSMPACPCCNKPPYKKIKSFLYKDKLYKVYIDWFVKQGTGTVDDKIYFKNYIEHPDDCLCGGESCDHEGEKNAGFMKNLEDMVVSYNDKIKGKVEKQIELGQFCYERQ